MTTGTSRGEDAQAAGERADRSIPQAEPTFFCRAVFAALGLLLLVAAGFKTFEAYSQPMTTPRLAGGLALICFEFCFGTWLLTGVKSVWTWRATAVCFAAFGSVSAYKVWTGAASCGCFGALQVNPAITLVIDLAAVALLMLCRTGTERSTDAKLQRVFPRVASLALTLSFLAAALSLYGQSRFVSSGGSTTAGDLVLLEPDTWPGGPWPLLGQPGVPVELASGTWDVMLFRHDCHVCHDVMRELQQRLSTQAAGERIALIGIDPPRDDPQLRQLQSLGCVVGYLPQDREWFVTTPVRIRLQEGTCVSAAVIEFWE